MGLRVGTFIGLLLSSWTVSPVLSFAPLAINQRQTTSLRMAGDDPLPSLNPKETAILICKFQNDFASEGGKIYDTVKEVMEVTNMKENSIHFVDLARRAGCTIVHCPISLEPVSDEILSFVSIKFLVFRYSSFSHVQFNVRLLIARARVV